MKLFLVRHGLSEGNLNKAKYFEKLDCDIELAERGKEDAKNAADNIFDISFKLLTQKLIYAGNVLDPIRYNMIHSPYLRAKQTADILYDRSDAWDGIDIVNCIETPLCREREWGGLRDIVELGKKTEEHFNFFYRPVNGESFADCFQRVAVFHQWLLQTSKYENTIVVAHGEFNKLYLMYLLNWSVEEFNKWRTPRNGEVYLINNGELSSLTPLSPAKYRNI